MAGSGEASFNSYTFTYKWIFDDLVTRLHNSSKLSSPMFRSPSRAEPTTEWMLTVYNGDNTLAKTPPRAPSQLSSSPLPSLSDPNCTNMAADWSPVRSHRLYNLDQDPILRIMVHVWVEARLKTQPSNFDDLTEFEATATSQGPVKLCLPRPGVACCRGSRSDNVRINFDQCLSHYSKYRIHRV